jgi:hypothetical protein
MLNFIVSGRWVAENEGPEVQSWGGEDLFHCGGVGTKGVKPTNMPTEAPTPHKKVSWRDALFPRRTLVNVDS